MNGDGGGMANDPSLHATEYVIFAALLLIVVSLCCLIAVELHAKQKQPSPRAGYTVAVSGVVQSYEESDVIEVKLPSGRRVMVNLSDVTAVTRNKTEGMSEIF
jgi:hypothetical protein